MKRAKPIVISSLVMVVVIIITIILMQLFMGKNSTNNGYDSANANESTKVTTKNSFVATGQNLTSFPEDTFVNTEITTLDISHNQITTLPAKIGELTQLENLIISNNTLDGSLPSEIQKMSLIKLDVSFNALTGVPAEVGRIYSLKYINLSNNKLSTLPNELSNIPVIETLDISNNVIESIADLTNYKNVKILKIGGNRLTAEQVTQLQNALPNTQVLAN